MTTWWRPASKPRRTPPRTTAESTTIQVARMAPVDQPPKRRVIPRPITATTPVGLVTVWKLIPKVRGEKADEDSWPLNRTDTAQNMTTRTVALGHRLILPDVRHPTERLQQLEIREQRLYLTTAPLCHTIARLLVQIP